MIRFCQGDIDPSIKARLYAGVLNTVPYYFANTRKRVSDELQIELTKTSSPYDKADIMNALSYDPINYEILYQKGIKSNDVILTTATVSSLANVLKAEKFKQVYRTSKAVEKVRGDILKYLRDIYTTDNVGAMAAASVVLRDPALGFKEEIESLDFLESATQNLKLPEHLETKIENVATLAYLSNKDYPDVEVEYNHPIDWTIVSALTDSSKAYILTNKGSVEISFFVDKAPGSVANFVNLVEAEFYDDKVFHRVVPNFVIQTGCPRGDGYGSLDYTIRSEYSDIHYDDEGYIGMASAGPNTESTQWFITHSPTPHLDGRYTIFGKVISGMDIVHQIQQGDIIRDIRIVRK